MCVCVCVRESEGLNVPAASECWLFGSKGGGGWREDRVLNASSANAPTRTLFIHWRCRTAGLEPSWPQRNGHLEPGHVTFNFYWTVIDLYWTNFYILGDEYIYFLNLILKLFFENIYLYSHIFKQTGETAAAATHLQPRSRSRLRSQASAARPLWWLWSDPPSRPRRRCSARHGTPCLKPPPYCWSAPRSSWKTKQKKNWCKKTKNIYNTTTSICCHYCKIPAY